MMKRIVLAVAVVALGVTAVVAQSDPIAARKALMKENGNQSRIAREMIEGKQPFDLAEAKKVLADFAGTRRQGQEPVARQFQDRRHRVAAGDLGEQGGLRGQARQVRRRRQGARRQA